MQVLNLEEKNTERINAINKFTLMDDTFMTQVFSGDLECTEELLKIILKRNDLSVTKSITQLTIGNLFGRSVRLDMQTILMGNSMILKSNGIIVEPLRNVPDLIVHYLIRDLQHPVKSIRKCQRHTLYLLHLMMFWLEDFQYIQ